MENDGIKHENILKESDIVSCLRTSPNILANFVCGACLIFFKIFLAINFSLFGHK